MKALISAAELKLLLGKPDVVILDGSYNLPPHTAAVPGAISFDIDAVAHPSAPLAHTLPPADVFETMVGAMGIDNNTHVIVYDRAGIAMAASRVWWMFRVFGHDKVQVLDGGLPVWTASGGPLGSKTAITNKKVFKAHFRPELFKQLNDIRANLTEERFTVLDARDPSRYAGSAAEPRPGMTGGHIPGSINTPYAALIDPSTGLMRSVDDLKKIFATIPNEKPIAISCGSGVTACVVALGLHMAGHDAAAVYGGSWAEWGANADLPKKTGTAP
jgi:thiosulfate/3-mercaptopyruvate sulfurtransferase